MERWAVFVLRHVQSGLYFGRKADHVTTMRQAYRWYSAEELEIWLNVAHHAPKDRDNYQPVEAEMMIGVNEHV